MQKKSQVKVDANILRFLDALKINQPDDLIILKDKILKYLEFKPYSSEIKEEADKIQWRRTASQIIGDGYVFEGKACSDLAIVFLAACNALGIEGQLVKLISLDKKETHSIVEVKIKNAWFRIDPSSRNAVPFSGRLNKDSIWNKKYKVWKKGRDVWDLGLVDKNSRL